MGRDGQHEGQQIMPASHHLTLVVYQATLAPVASEELYTLGSPWGILTQSLVRSFKASIFLDPRYGDLLDGTLGWARVFELQLDALLSWENVPCVSKRKFTRLTGRAGL